MKRLLLVLIALLFASSAFAKDTYIRGYTRKDGTYVRPHIRSSPNQYKWDNYGRSKSDSELLNPKSRDTDSDGTPNYLDSDDDNDGIADDNE